jgi:hypothetical protein
LESWKKRHPLPENYRLIIGSSSIDPADDGIFLCRGQCGALWHLAGLNGSAYLTACIKYLGIVGQWPGTIHTSRCMATGNIAGRLDNRIDIGGKSLIGHGAAIGPVVSAALILTAGKSNNGGKKDDQGKTIGFRHAFVFGKIIRTN